jgi:hypothetical protein
MGAYCANGPTAVFATLKIPSVFAQYTHSSSTATEPPDSDGIVAISSGQVPSVATRTSPLLVFDTVPMA